MKKKLTPKQTLAELAESSLDVSLSLSTALHYHQSKLRMSADEVSRALTRLSRYHKAWANAAKNLEGKT